MKQARAATFVALLFGTDTYTDSPTENTWAGGRRRWLGVALGAAIAVGAAAPAHAENDCDPNSASGECECEVGGLPEITCEDRLFSGRLLWICEPDPLPSGDRALIVVLHGGAGNPKQFLDDEGGCRLAQLGQRDGFVVVLPKGTRPNVPGFPHWDDCREDNELTGTWGSDPDHIGYIQDLIDAAVAGTGIFNGIDIAASRVYVTGKSNGAIMAYRAATEMPVGTSTTRPAGIAAIAGNQPENSDCTPDPPSSSDPDPIDVLIMNGTDDPIMPYGGGCVEPDADGIFIESDLCNRAEEDDSDTGKVLPTELVAGDTDGDESTLGIWMQRVNGCDTSGSTLPFEDVDTTDGPENGETSSTVDVTTYRGCTDGAEVKLYKVTDGGHWTPGTGNACRTVAQVDFNCTNEDIDGMSEIWDFFQARELSDDFEDWQGQGGIPGPWDDWEPGHPHSSRLHSSTGAAMADGSSKGLMAQLDPAKHAYVVEEDIGDVKSYRARFWLGPEHATDPVEMANGEKFNLMLGQNSANVWTFALVLNQNGTTAAPDFQVFVQTWEDDATYFATQKISLGSSERLIEIRWRAASTSSSSDGYVCVTDVMAYRESGKHYCQTGLENDGKAIDKVSLGAVSGLDTNTNGKLHIDDFDSFTF